MLDQHSRMQVRISNMRRELDRIEGRIRRERDPAKASQLIERFNRGVSEYNLAVEDVRVFSQELNSIIGAYNCRWMLIKRV